MSNPILYYTNAGGDKDWGNLLNWNTAADGSGDNPTEAPWSNSDDSTLNYDLADASGGVGVTIYPGSYNSYYYPIGTCSIPKVTFENNVNVNGGTWSGINILIKGGCYINYSTFSGSGFTADGSSVLYSCTFNEITVNTINPQFPDLWVGAFQPSTWIWQGNTIVLDPAGPNYCNESSSATYGLKWMIPVFFTGFGSISAIHPYLANFPIGNTYYTNGEIDTSKSGLFYAVYSPYGSTYLYTNGVWPPVPEQTGGFVGGYNGQYYDYYTGGGPTSYTGLASDYYFSNDPTGTTSYLFVNGVFTTGGYLDKHYTSGISDSFTGVDIDYSNGTTIETAGTVYVNGFKVAGYYAGYNGVLYYQTGGPTTLTGLYPDYYLDPTGVTQYCFVNGVSADPDCAGTCGGSCVGCSNDYFGNYCCTASIQNDFFGNSLCDGFTPSCTDFSACGEDTIGCLYLDDCGVCGGSCHSGCDTCGNCGGVNGCTNSTSCNYNPSATCDDGSCYWGCNDPGARNYYDGCNYCWYTDCNDGTACTYDSNSFGTSECTWGCNDPGARNYHSYCDYCWYVDCNDYNACNYDSYSFGTSECLYFDNCGNCGGVNGCNNSSACNYNSLATCDDGSCYWNCTDPGARNYLDGCNNCWYVDCNDGSACNYDPNSFGSSECYWGCNDPGARNYHYDCQYCWYTDCNDYNACNYDSYSPGTSECNYPVDNCHDCYGNNICPPDYSTLYYTNASGDYTWENLANWNYFNDGFTVLNPDHVPWTDDGNGGAWYANYLLINQSGNSAINIYSDIDPNGAVTGSCDIPFWLYSGYSIGGGTYTGIESVSEGTINNGNFTGSNFLNGYDYTGIINGGNFSGDNFINGGNGDPFSTIHGGTFSGNGFINHGVMAGGQFEITGFTNSGTIDYQNINITQNGSPYTGVWQNQVWDNGVWVSSFILTTLYYTNVSGDFAWENLANWNTAADGSGLNPTHVPWTDDGNGGDWYGNIDLINSSTITDSNGRYVVIYDNIGPNGTVTGTCSIPQIQFWTTLINPISVTSGKFTGSNSTNFGNLIGGQFEIDGLALYAGYVNFSNITITYLSQPFTGIWQGQIWNNGVWVSAFTTLYFTNAGGDGTWETLTNWNTEADGSGITPSNTPWTDDGSGGARYSNVTLEYPNQGVNSITINPSTTISSSVAGICNISNISCFGTINGGTWNGDYVYAASAGGLGSGIINGGTFNGNYCGTDQDNGSGTGGGLVTGGTWNGSFYNDGRVDSGTFNAYFKNSGIVNNGLFTGNNFDNGILGFGANGIINGGTFRGIDFTNSSIGYIYYGTFEINGFTNNGIVYFDTINVTQFGIPYTGVWQNQVWDNGVWIRDLTTTLYYTNASGDFYWETLSNWNTAADGSGLNPTHVPWTDNGRGGAWYENADLVDTVGRYINVYYFTTIDPNYSVTGTCNIPSVVNYGTVNGGTFTGDQSVNNGTINGGTFTGNWVTYGPSNSGTINGGTFTGDYFSNAYYIYGGTFSGNYFWAYGIYYSYIYGGVFTGSGSYPYPQTIIGYTGGIYYPNIYNTYAHVTNGYPNCPLDSYTGTDYDYDTFFQGPILRFYLNGIAASAGYNGVHYGYSGDGTADSYTGFDYDYGYDPSGQAQYFFYNGTALTGGYDGVHYTNGTSDNYTGFDYDYYQGLTICFVNGIAGTPDVLGNCGGTCNDPTACNSDSFGCLYYACNGNCTSRTPTLYPNCPTPSINPSLLQTYKLGILPIPSNNPAIRNRLLAEINNFPLILQASLVPTIQPILYLDAGNTLSYNGGSTWTDLKSGIIFDLYNSPTFDSNFEGSLFFETSALNWAKSRTSLPSLSSWTVETWHYYTNTNTGIAPCIITEELGGNGRLNYNIGNDTYHSSTELNAGYYNGSDGGWHSTDTITLTANNWYHIVGSFDGSNIKFYINGSLISTSTNNTALAESSGNGTRLMRRWDTDDYWGGNLAIVRIYDTALSDSKVLQNYNSTKNRFYIAPPPPFTNRILSNNTAVVAQSPFGSGNAYGFDGVTQFINIDNQGDFAFTGDFTIEWFEYRTDSNPYVRPFTINEQQSVGISYEPAYGGILCWWDGQSWAAVGSIPANNVWNHMALVRVGNNINFYVNGNLTGTRSATGSFNDIASTLYIGCEKTNALPGTYFGGLITNFRLTNGLAVYTGNFTVPTSQLTQLQSASTNIAAITDPALVKVLLIP